MLSVTKVLLPITFTPALQAVRGSPVFAVACRLAIFVPLSVLLTSTLGEVGV